MSLATSGGMGAGAGGGLSMASSAHVGNAVAASMPSAPPMTEIPGGGGIAAPVNLSALGADLVDKSQQISLKQVKDLSKMPIVAIDLYSSEPIVASFPPKVTGESSADDYDLFPSVVGKMKEKIALKTTEGSHKTFRKWLSKSKGYKDLQSDVFTKLDDKSAVVVQSPELWLGLRRLEEGPDYLKKFVTHDDSNSPAIAEESSPNVGITLANGTLDGSVPQGDDFDRVVCKVRLHETKKSLTVLPEEILQIILNQAQYHVARKISASSSSSTGGGGGDEDDIESVMSYPCAIAVPAPYCNDQSIEALLDATGNTGVIFQRSVCALAGSLLPGTPEKPNPIDHLLLQTIQERQKIFQLEQIKNPKAVLDSSLVVLLAGMTKDTAECTAIQISSKQEDKLVCPYGNFQVMCNVSYRHENPESILSKCMTGLFESLDDVAPEASTPVAMITYGSSIEQMTIRDKWDKLKKGLETWEDVPQFLTKSDCVANGTGVLGAVSHGRLSNFVRLSNKKRPKAQLAIQTQNVAPVAVGVTMNYHGDEGEKWTPVKIIFDFDRRVPAGPHALEFSAAECAVLCNGKTSDVSAEKLEKLIKEKEAAKHIPEREKAALNFRVQVVQKFTRDGEWVKVGDPMSPLSIVEKDEQKTACEKVTLELSLGLSGLITQSLFGDRQSVVQATKSARNSTIIYYFGILFAILFVGGFLVKSYWDDHILNKDTRRLLAYYKHALPGTMLDGDFHNARYVAYKYRHKKNTLWKLLEKKYDVKVLEEHEWDDFEDQKSNDESEEEHEDLDEEDSTGDEEQEL